MGNFSTLAAPSSARQGHPCPPHALRRTTTVRSARELAAEDGGLSSYWEGP